jgi:preprotein translocase subunit SecE
LEQGKRARLMTVAEKVNQTAAAGGQEERKLPAWIERLLDRPRRWRQFLHDVRLEMRQVTWPSRHDVTVTTSVVIVTVAAFGVYFFFVDSGVQWVMKHLWNIFKH